MALTKLERPINQAIHIEQPIVRSFCDGEFHLTYEDKKFFGITRKLFARPSKDRKKNNQLAVQPPSM